MSATVNWQSENCNVRPNACELQGSVETTYACLVHLHSYVCSFIVYFAGIMTLLPILGLLGPFISSMWYPATRAFATHCSTQVHPLPQPNLTQYGCDIPDFEMDFNLLQLFHTQDGIIFAHHDLFDWNFCT